MTPSLTSMSLASTVLKEHRVTVCVLSSFLLMGVLAFAWLVTSRGYDFRAGREQVWMLELKSP